MSLHMASGIFNGWDDVEGKTALPGLYCAGDCSGSLFSGNYPDQMHGVACGRTMTEALHVVKLVAAK